MHAIRALYKISGASCLPDIVPLIKDEAWLVKEGVAAVMTRHIDEVLPFIRPALAGYDNTSKLACINALVEAGHIARILQETLSRQPATSEPARRILGDLIETKFYFGLKKELDRFSKEERQRLLQIIADFDSELARHIGAGDEPTP